MTNGKFEKIVEAVKAKQGGEIAEYNVQPSDRSNQHFCDTLEAAMAFRKQAASFIKKRTDRNYYKALRAFRHFEECWQTAWNYVIANRDSDDQRVIGGVMIVTQMLRPRVEPMYQLWQPIFAKLEAGEALTVTFDRSFVEKMFPTLPETYRVENDGTVVSLD
jgi:hypothetical protein